MGRVGETLAGVHPPGAERLWGESWYFDFAAADGTAGGFVRVGDYPQSGLRSYWAYVVAGGHAAGHAVDLPLPRDRDIPWRAADSVLRFLAEPVTGGWRISADGDGFLLDVTWRAQAPEYGYARGSRLEQPGWAVGEVSLGGRSLALDGPGQRDHSWGVRDWWRFGWTWCAGRLCDGTRFQATTLEARGRIAPDGYLMAPDGPPEPVHDVAVEGDSVRLNDTMLEFADIAHVTVELRSPDGELSRLRRAMTRVRAGEARYGIGWRERNLPVRAARRT